MPKKTKHLLYSFTLNSFGLKDVFVTGCSSCNGADLTLWGESVKGPARDCCLLFLCCSNLYSSDENPALGWGRRQAQLPADPQDMTQEHRISFKGCLLRHNLAMVYSVPQSLLERAIVKNKMLALWLKQRWGPSFLEGLLITLHLSSYCSHNRPLAMTPEGKNSWLEMVL